MIQFFHQRESGNERTYALDVPSIDAIEMYNISTPISIALGMARCNQMDQYCKKTGRELAIQRIIEHQFIVRHVHNLADGLYLDLFSLDNKTAIRLRLLKGSDKVHFLDAHTI